ncbi:MAG TPA: hypothetical protein VIP80_01650 [Gemmatimonadales bacterium]|jgi:hypothetical protein
MSPALGLLIQLLPLFAPPPAAPTPTAALQPYAEVRSPGPLLRREWVDWAMVRAQAAPPSQDTARTRRPTTAIEYSNFYHARLTLHRWLSFAMLPLFAGSYFSGDQVLRKGDAAPSWARRLHTPLAAGTAVVFSVNTITGAWNLWESRKDPAGRVKRYVHTLLFVAAGAGFVYAASKVGDDDEPGSRHLEAHRNIALASMGISVSSWALMLFFK